jgi:ABC-type bacteriocin/lantibiotic exporter with double-glycine peptidase domain
MALAIIILATFIIPAIIFGFILYWRNAMRKRVKKQEEENGALINIMEEIIDTKDSIIDKLKT